VCAFDDAPGHGSYEPSAEQQTGLREEFQAVDALGAAGVQLAFTGKGIGPDPAHEPCRIVHDEEQRPYDFCQQYGKRKGENELLGKDIQRLDETVNLKLKNITETQNEIKTLIEKLHAEILIISKKK
jgi:hypothetical protein